MLSMSHRFSHADISVCFFCEQAAPTKSTLRNGTGGAGIRTGTAIDAGIGINYILCISLRDSTCRAGVGAGAAADTGVANYISHWKHPQFLKL